METKEKYFFVKEFEIPMFRCEICFIISNDHAKSMEYCNEKFFNTSNLSDWDDPGFTGVSQAGEIFVCVQELDICTIFHEIIHATRHVFETLNEYTDTKEFFAYISEFIFKNIIEFCAEKELITITHNPKFQEDEK